MDAFTFEQTYIGTQKAYFKSFFNKDADENQNEFLMYLNERTNRRLIGELEDFNKNFKELKESGILDNLNG
jgi:hypothetical protein